MLRLVAMHGWCCLVTYTRKYKYKHIASTCRTILLHLLLLLLSHIPTANAVFNKHNSQIFAAR